MEGENRPGKSVHIHACRHAHAQSIQPCLNLASKVTVHSSSRVPLKLLYKMNWRKKSILLQTHSHHPKRRKEKNIQRAGIKKEVWRADRTLREPPSALHAERSQSEAGWWGRREHRFQPLDPPSAQAKLGRARPKERKTGLSGESPWFLLNLWNGKLGEAPPMQATREKGKCCWRLKQGKAGWGGGRVGYSEALLEDNIIQRHWWTIKPHPPTPGPPFWSLSRSLLSTTAEYQYKCTRDLESCAGKGVKGWQVVCTKLSKWCAQQPFQGSTMSSAQFGEGRGTGSQVYAVASLRSENMGNRY